MHIFRPAKIAWYTANGNWGQGLIKSYFIWHGCVFKSSIQAGKLKPAYRLWCTSNYHRRGAVALEWSLSILMVFTWHIWCASTPGHLCTSIMLRLVRCWVVVVVMAVVDVLVASLLVLAFGVLQAYSMWPRGIWHTTTYESFELQKFATFRDVPLSIFATICATWVAFIPQKMPPYLIKWRGMTEVSKNFDVDSTGICNQGCKSRIMLRYAWRAPSNRPRHLFVRPIRFCPRHRPCPKTHDDGMILI
jgi:hypothetical protein